MAVQDEPAREPVSERTGQPHKAVQSANLAKFEGSFAASARPTTVRVKPWYADRDYFLQGWTSPAIWKAAVGQLHLFQSRVVEVVEEDGLNSLTMNSSWKESPLLVWCIFLVRSRRL